MSKKKSKKKKKRMQESASDRNSKVIRQMTAPPETVMNHLKRVGIDPIIDKMSMDGQEPEVYVLFRYQELIDKELELFAKQKNQSHTKARPMGSPVIMDEIRKRIEESIKRHPSYQSKIKDESQLSFDKDEDNWSV